MYPKSSESGHATIVPIRKKDNGQWPTQKEVWDKALEVRLSNKFNPHAEPFLVPILAETEVF